MVVADAEAQDGRRRRATVQGTDVYATTAACAAHAAALLAEGAGAGALAPAQAFAAEPFLDHVGLAARHDLSTMGPMEGFGFFQDPDFQKRLQEMAEQMQTTQNLAWADNAIKLAVDMTVAAINRVNIQGTTEQQAQQIRAVMATVFPEAVTLVREARQGLS